MTARVHFQREGHGTSLCGHGRHPNLTGDPEEVTCLMCRSINDGTHGPRRRDTAADALEDLEAICWRLKMNAVTMQPILIAARRYAERAADERVDAYFTARKRLEAAAVREARKVA